MGEHDARQKLNMKTRVESRRPIKDSDIQVGDTVLVKQPKMGKFSIPYHPVPLTVTNKSHSMLTAKGGDRKVTFSNSSYFKELDQDHADAVQIDHSSADPVSTDTNSSADQVPTDTNLSADPESVDANSSESGQAEPQLRRSTRVPKPSRRLIQEIDYGRVLNSCYGVLIKNIQEHPGLSDVQRTLNKVRTFYRIAVL